MRCPQQPVLTAPLLKSERIFENESSSEESEVDTGIEEDGIQTVPTLPHTRRNRIKQRKLVFNVAEPMKVEANSELLKRISNMTLEVKEKIRSLNGEIGSVAFPGESWSLVCKDQRWLFVRNFTLQTAYCAILFVWL